MTDRILDKYIGRKGGDDRHGDHDAADSLGLADSSGGGGGGDAADDLGCFGWLRGVRDRAVMLELRKADGSIMAIGYSWLERAEFDPTEGITLHVLGRTVRIKGRNLNGEARPQVRLFHGITRHRVPWIQQGDESAIPLSCEDAMAVHSIDW